MNSPRRHGDTEERVRLRGHSAKEHPRTIVERATDDFLRHLQERNASAHTIKAYTGDLDVFAAYIGALDPEILDWKTIDHIAIRGFLSHLYDKGLSKTSVARALAARAVALSLAGAGRRGRAESGEAGFDAAAAEEAAARSDD